jgi:hypothetical protein
VEEKLVEAGWRSISEFKKTDAFDHHRAKNPEITRPYQAPPKWRSHFV